LPPSPFELLRKLTADGEGVKSNLLMEKLSVFDGLKDRPALVETGPLRPKAIGSCMKYPEGFPEIGHLAAPEHTHYFY
jgi:hypothetical protein